MARLIAGPVIAVVQAGEPADGENAAFEERTRVGAGVEELVVAAVEVAVVAEVEIRAVHALEQRVRVRAQDGGADHVDLVGRARLGGCGIG